MRIQGQTAIRRPLAEVFDFVADERNNYDPNVTDAELLTGEPIGIGTRFRSTSVRRGRPVDMIVEIVEYDRPTRLVTVTHLAGIDILSTLTLATEDAGTRLLWTSELEPRGLLRLLAPVLAIYGRRQTRALWTNLKQTLETEPNEVPGPR
jgi:carbon monoxide dehydrogenase subunit G